jgi:hypothetical protein
MSLKEKQRMTQFTLRHQDYRYSDIPVLLPTEFHK